MSRTGPQPLLPVDVTSEMDPATHAMARERIDRELRQGDLFEGEAL